MATTGPGVLDRLRRPEYTGENRCIPCTAVNVLIGAVVTAGLWLVEPLLAGAFALLAAGAIWLRGYLVPGTPALTKRYFPDRVLRWFDKEPATGVQGPASERPAPEEATDVESYLLEVDAVEPAGDDLVVADEFERVWLEAIERVEADPGRVAGDLLDLENPELAEYPNRVAVTDGGFTVAQWPSRAALLADLGGIEALRERDETWDGRDAGEQGRILAGLRVFIETCPECGGTPELGEETVSSCCRDVQVFTYTCGDCGARLLEIEQ